MTSNIHKQLSFFLPSASGVWVQQLLEKNNVLWCVYANEIELHEAKLSIKAFNPAADILIFPQWDTLPYAAASPSIGIQMQRQFVLETLRHNKKNLIVLSTLGAIVQKIGTDVHTASQVRIYIGQSLNTQDLAYQLSSLGFNRVESIYQVGEFSIRGGIVDIFPSSSDMPYRIDLFGEEVENIHLFDPATQRRNKDIQVKNLTISNHQEVLLNTSVIEIFKKNYITFYGAEGRGEYYRSIIEQTPISGWEQLYPLFFTKTASIIESFPDVTFLLPSKSTFIEYINEINESYQYRKTLWDSTNIKERQLLPIQPDLMYCTNFEFDILRQPNTHIYSAFKQVDGLDYGIRPLEPLLPESAADKMQGSIKQAKTKLIYAVYEEQDIRYLKSAYTTLFNKDLYICSKWHEVKNSDAQVLLWQEKILHGFKTESYQIITASELFGERQIGFRKRKTIINPEDIISQATTLSVGDLIVHRHQGIGRYLGLETIEIYNITHDCLALEYAGQDKLYLPVENIELISRYGNDQGTVSLDKLGGTAWQTRQVKVKKQLRTIAKYLMDIAAKRSLKTAPVITVQEGAFQDFCRRFTFVETEDQEKAILDVTTDLAKGTPMDRLICGDVGFGKTEVALRAAFLALSNGYQVAIIAPTTILVRQHYYTFLKRFEGLGYRIEQLSRLISHRQFPIIKQDTENGNVSILIGTHALLSDSIKFKKLGLLIIDEEQMFGVKQKEKIKELSDNLHILTLSATPIPRTLQMSLLGIKEMSLIATPPVDRRAIHTTLLEEDPIVLHQAIRHEIDRGGQIFYVCPRITDLDEVYASLQKTFPNLNITIAHGKLKAEQLEARLMEFISGKTHILLSTQIIESGIDIPNANTMIIHNAHLFGLSQLYQLRGRIGRSARQAYAYLIVPQGRTLKPTAVKRLQVMSTLDALGAGFTLASHDMDIRGAGNLLGEEQSGHVKDVGVELYQEMLKQAVNSLKKSGVLDTEEDEIWSPILSLGLSVSLPESYIPDIETRMELYRRLGTLRNNDQVNEMRIELLDRFGRLPPEAENLIDTIKVKILCRNANIQKAEAGPNGVLLTFRNNQCPYVDKLLELIRTNTHYKLRPDSKLFYQWTIDDIQLRIKAIKTVCKTLGGFTLVDSLAS
jgi:transcription-repair coupling factor (superfamily II helicase)